MTLPAAPTAKVALDFEALYRATRDDVFGYVATLLHDRSAAEDVTAQAFERAFRKARRYDPDKGGPRAWLFGIARHAALAGLPPRDRELIALKFHAGLDNAELAAVLGVSVSNAGTQLHRAMTKLRRALDDRS